MQNIFQRKLNVKITDLKLLRIFLQIKWCQNIIRFNLFRYKPVSLNYTKFFFKGKKLEILV